MITKAKPQNYGQDTKLAYLNRVKDWKIKWMTARYIDAFGLYNSTLEAMKPKAKFPQRTLQEICEILYDIKEEHHQLFKRVIGPAWLRIEDEHKIDPSQAEIDFIANVGLLFHKVLVTRELNYINEHYDKLVSCISDTQEELPACFREIYNLFQAGIQVIMELLRSHSKNLLLLSYLFDESDHIKKNIGTSGLELLESINGSKNIEAIYFLIGKYYADSGWYDRAAKLMKRILAKNPKHVEARKMLEELRYRTVANKGSK